VANYRDTLLDELAKLETDLLYTEKAHFSAAEHFKALHFLFGGIAAVAAAATAADVANSSSAWETALPLLAAVAAAVVTFVKPLATAERHIVSGRQIGALRVSVRQVRDLDGRDDSGVADPALREQITVISDQKASLHTDAPATGPLAFWRAQRKVKKGHFGYDG
jgi:hypothetical protein